MEYIPSLHNALLIMVRRVEIHLNRPIFIARGVFFHGQLCG